MTFFLRIELNEDINPPDMEGNDNLDTALPIEQPQPIVVELVEKATLGRGEDPSKLMGSSMQELDPQSNQAFNRQLDLLTNPHIDLSAFHAHNRGVSRKHARITLQNTRLSVADLGSTNGTYVNNSKLEPNVEYPLKEGDDLRLGFLSLRVTLI